MNNIIGITGISKAGKTTMAQYIKSVPGYEDYEIINFGDSLKDIVSYILNVPRSKLEEQSFKAMELPEYWKTDNMVTIRDMLQRVGTEAFRDNIHADTWVNVLKSKYTPDKKWLIADVRFPNEADWIESIGGRMVRILRPDIPVMSHYSEHALDDKNYSCILNNGTLIEFYLKIDEWLSAK